MIKILKAQARWMALKIKIRKLKNKMMKLVILCLCVPWLSTLKPLPKLRYLNSGSSCPEKITDNTKKEKALENAGKKEKPKDMRWSMKFKSLKLRILSFKKRLLILKKTKISKLIATVTIMI